MSIQQTVNQGLAVAAALGTQTALYEDRVDRHKEKLAKRQDEKEYKKLIEQNKREIASLEPGEKPNSDFFDRMADNFQRRNFLKPRKELLNLSMKFRQRASELRKQEEANEVAEAQRLAKKEQRKRIGEMIMRV